MSYTAPIEILGNLISIEIQLYFKDFACAQNNLPVAIINRFLLFWKGFGLKQAVFKLEILEDTCAEIAGLRSCRPPIPKLEVRMTDHDPFTLQIKY